MNAITYLLEKDGKQVAKFDGDFVNSSEKDKGYFTQYNIKGNTNPLESCVPFNLHNDKEMVAYATDTDADNIAIDLPVGALLQLQEMFCSIDDTPETRKYNLELFYNSYGDKGYELNLVVPIGGEKDVDNTLKLLASIFEGLNLRYNINIIIVVNVGLLLSRGFISEVAKYEEFMQLAVFNKNITIKEVRMTTKFDVKGIMSRQLHNTKFETFLAARHDGLVQVLVGGVKNDLKNLYEAIK